jgi:hypothetical protein
VLAAGHPGVDSVSNRVVVAAAFSAGVVRGGSLFCFNQSNFVFAVAIAGLEIRQVTNLRFHCLSKAIAVGA